MSNIEQNSGSDSLVVKKLSMNARLSAARIFDEDSNDFTENNSPPKSSAGKMRYFKTKTKHSPYKKDETRTKKIVEYETDPQILQRRQKQIDYGKNTIGYDNYVKLIPKDKRKREHPSTPVKYYKYSRRCWDGLIRVWRQKLHEFDPEEEEEENKVKIEKTEEMHEELEEDIEIKPDVHDICIKQEFEESLINEVFQVKQEIDSDSEVEMTPYFDLLPEHQDDL